MSIQRMIWLDLVWQHRRRKQSESQLWDLPAIATAGSFMLFMKVEAEAFL